MNYRLNTKGLEKPSIIEGVRHFKDRKDAIKYVAFKYGIEMKFVPEIPGQVRARYEGRKYDRETGMITEIITPAGEWADDHDVIEIYRHPWDDIDNRQLIEFCTYADAYTYAYRHSREYNFIKTV